ncbi:MAG: hypothetical protein ACI87O_001528 [Planctomycetota bacterium]|jgi:hypothetical protein
MAAAQSDEDMNRLGQGARTMIQQEFSWQQTAYEMHRILYRLPLDNHQPQDAA